MWDHKWLGVGSALLSLFTVAERNAINSKEWAPNCNLRVELCDPSQKPWIADSSRPTLINTIGGSSNVVFAANSVQTATATESFTVSLEGQTILTPWGPIWYIKSN